MKKIKKCNVFVCNSPIQIMRAIQMKLKIEYFNGEADIFVSDIFDGADKVVYNLKKINVFRNIYLINQSELDSKKTLAYIFSRKNNIFKENKYTKMIAFNVSSKQARILYNINKNNEGFEYHCVEDVPSVYAIPFFKKQKWYSINALFNNQQEYYNITKWWSSCPELISVPKSYCTELERLPFFDYNDDKLVEYVNITFGYEDNECLNNADVLIMDESHYQDNLMIDNADYKLYMEIVNRYKNSNFVMKMHPRTQHNRYKDKINILSNLHIPWEVYVMNRARNSSKDMIQLSICCSTMISDKLMFGYEGTKIFMAPLFYDKIKHGNDNAPRVSKEMTKKIEEFKDKYEQKDRFIIINTKEELYNVLDNKLKNVQN